MELVDSSSPDNPIYSGMIIVDVYTPSLVISGGSNYFATNIAWSPDAILKGSAQHSPIYPQAAVVATNYWANCDLSGLVFTWYEQGNNSSILTGQTYEFSSTDTAGNYYCVVTDSNYPSWAGVTSNTVYFNGSAS